MSIEDVGTLIVGCGQAGIAMSEHLSNINESHLILERSEIAERWRSERWDSLVANGPAWHDRFPNMEFEGLDPDAFASRQDVVDYFVAYASMIKAPVRCGVEVTNVQKAIGKNGFVVETSAGSLHARNVVAATGAFQHPVYPSIVPESIVVEQLHSCAYRNPAQLREGAILVVGAGSSGTQIAEELAGSGKSVYLSVGPHDRPPRRYRRHDFVWWLGVLGKWDAQALEPGLEHVTIAVSGANGGNTVDFRELATRGVTLVGLTQSYENGVIRFASDLADNLAKGDANYLSVLDEADAYIERNGLDLPQDPDARVFAPVPNCVEQPIRELDVASAGISSIIWATGYSVDYGWLDVDIFSADGKPLHQRGVSAEPGIYFLGLPWQSRRGSSFIWGVWHDAKYLADHIATQRGYLEHHLASRGSI
ncbi:MAG: flavin-containing monooxygenase [Granulosicoccus sp.]